MTPQKGPRVQIVEAGARYWKFYTKIITASDSKNSAILGGRKIKIALSL